MWTYEEISMPLKVWMLVLAVVLAARISPRRVPMLRAAKRHVHGLAKRPWLCGAAIVLVSLAFSAMLTAMRYPLPWTHDEFSYLLASDTYAHGRLTNRAHPHWEHFETFHVLSQPSYASKYPPGNGLAMATGQWLTGHPIVGAWLALAFACGSVYWMFRAWLSPNWAALGGLIVACHAPLLRAWGQSYWGGAVALLGGALVFGALRRIWREPKLIDSCLLALGLVLLANTRPMEGLLASIPVFVSLAIWFIRYDSVSWYQKSTRVVVPICLIGVLGIAGIAGYNRVVTGDAVTMPYQLHDEKYSASSLVVWSQPPQSPVYNHARMEQFFHSWGRDRQLSLQTPTEYTKSLGRKFRLLWDFMPLCLGICLLTIPWLWKNAWMKFALLTIGLILVIQTQLATSWMYPHYLAPIIALFFFVNVQCLRRLRVWQRHQGWGPMLARAVVIFAILKLVPTIIDWQKPTRLHPRFYVTQRLPSNHQHLVIVSYERGYRIVDEWVYNAANIDDSRIVWARDMGKEKNEQLIEYFSGRKIWRWHLESDEDMTLRPYDTDQMDLIAGEASP